MPNLFLHGSWSKIRDFWYICRRLQVADVSTKRKFHRSKWSSIKFLKNLSFSLSFVIFERSFGRFGKFKFELSSGAYLRYSQVGLHVRVFCVLKPSVPSRKLVFGCMRRWIIINLVGFTYSTCRSSKLSTTRSECRLDIPLFLRILLIIKG